MINQLSRPKATKDATRKLRKTLQNNTDNNTTNYTVTALHIFQTTVTSRRGRWFTETGQTITNYCHWSDTRPSITRALLATTLLPVLVQNTSIHTSTSISIQ